MIDVDRILTVIRKATLLLRATPGRQGSIVSLDSAEDVLVVGDLHGHLHNFRAALTLADLPSHPTRHLVLQELIHDPRVDPDDGVDLSHRLVDLACALKCQYPGRVHIILGNHELSELTNRSIGKDGAQLNDLFKRGLDASYGERAETVRAAYMDLFTAMPLAIRTPNRVLICHTVPDARFLDSLDLDLLRSGRWSPESMARGGTVYALTWGRDCSPQTADQFAQLMDVDHFVTGHHPCDEGFLVLNHRHLALDATDPNPGACLFPTTQPLSLDQLRDGVRLLGERA